jgi:glycosyltransferase involved in cell wall biosynthesis
VKKISVIVPCYNVAEYLEVTVRSLLEQSYHHFELILVNDGSTDGTAIECDKFASSDSRLKVLHQENQGVVAARHNGFKIATGEIIMFVDGDDTLEANALQCINDVFDTDGMDLVRFGYNKIDPILSLNEPLNPSIEGFVTLNEILDFGVQDFKRHCSSSIWDKAYSYKLVDELFLDLGNVRINHSEDMLFAIAAVIRSKGVLFLQEPLYNYVQRPGSVIHSLNPKAIESKELYFSALQKCLMQYTNKAREVEFKKILESEANESVNYVLFNTLTYSPSFSSTWKIMSELKKTSFFRCCCKRTGPVVLKQRIRERVISIPILATCILVCARYVRSFAS